MEYVYSLYDVKAEAYSPPFVSESRALACRCVEGALRDPQMVLSMYPEDFILYEIGSFDKLTGLLKSVVPPVHVAAVSSFVSNGFVKREIGNGAAAAVSDDASVLASSSGDDSSKQVSSD